MPNPGWREYIIGISLLLAGCIFLVVQVGSILQGEHSIFESNGDIHISRSEFFNELRIDITIAASIAGGWLLIRQRKTGWILSLAMLLLFSAIALGALLSLIQLQIYDTGFFIAMAGGCYMLFLLLLHLSLNNKFVLQKNDWIRAILLCTILGLFYFLLQ